MGFFDKLFKRNVEGIVAPNQYYNPSTDDYEIQQGFGGAANVTLAGSNVPDSQAIPVKIAGADSNGGAINTNVKSSDIIQPVDIQSRYAQTVQAHNTVNIPAYDRSYSQWIDVSGFNEIEITTIGQGDIFDCYIEFSHDTNRVVFTDAFSYNNEGSQIDSEGAFSQKVRTRYVRVIIMNPSSGVLVSSSWLYLKC
jgi:hypothetical protein